MIKGGTDDLLNVFKPARPPLTFRRRLSPPVPPRPPQAENCLLTSWSWVYLADFAPYKPTFLPADNPVRELIGFCGPGRFQGQ